MTNREKLNSMTNEELADLFCDTMEKMVDRAELVDKDLCDICLFYKNCYLKHNGFRAWLEKEAEG